MPWPLERPISVQAVSVHTELKGQSQESMCKGQLTVWTAGASGICGKIHGPGKEGRYGGFVKLK